MESVFLIPLLIVNGKCVLNSTFNRMTSLVDLKLLCTVTKEISKVL